MAYTVGTLSGAETGVVYEGTGYLCPNKCTIPHSKEKGTVHTHKLAHNCFEVRDGQRVSHILTSVLYLAHKSTSTLMEVELLMMGLEPDDMVPFGPPP